MTADDLANAMMKAETKAKRRVTLSICGLGMLDETEMATVREVPTTPTGEVARATVNVDTGEMIDAEVVTPTPAPQAPQATNPAPQAQAAEPVVNAPAPRATTRARREGPTNEALSADDGLLRVTRFRVAQRGTNTRGPWTRWLVSFSDGVEASTFDEAVATRAREAGEAGNPVEVQTAPSSNGRGVNLLSLEPFFVAEVNEADEPQAPDFINNDDDMLEG